MSTKTIQRLQDLYEGMYYFAEDLIHDRQDYTHSIWNRRTFLQYLSTTDIRSTPGTHVEASMWVKQRILSYTRRANTHWYGKYMQTP